MKLRTAISAAALALASQAALATPALFFIIDGDTFFNPFSITNQSDAGERVTRFQLNIAPANMVFDTVDNGPPGNGTAGVPLTPRSGTEVTTGLVMPATVADGSAVMDISFTGFDALESFVWDIDVDGASGQPVSVFGNNLIGSLATIDFSNGERLVGVLSAIPCIPGTPPVCNADASQFVVTGRTITPTVPEPGTLALAGLALLAVGAAQRKRS